MTLRTFDAQHGWLLRLLTPPLVVLFGVAMLYFKSEFFTRVEAASLVLLPSQIENIEGAMLALEPLPIRVQILEERTANLTSDNIKRDLQIERIVGAIGKLSIQQAQALQKLDDMNRRSERMENKLDSVSRKVDQP